MFKPSELRPNNIWVVSQQKCCIIGAINSRQAKRFLAQRGCSFEPGKGGHLIVRRENRRSVLPQHGGRKELGKGLWLKILKDLDLKE
jgi:mRNA interferase HicA